MKPSFTIVGCGRVGTALGRQLVKAGYKLVGLASKTITSAEKAAGIIGTGEAFQTPWEASKSADVVFITTPDGVINECCEEISKKKGFKKDAIVLHCSGALPSTILSGAKKCNVLTGSMHPLQSFANSYKSGSPFEGIVISVEGDKAAVDISKKIAKELGAVSIEIKTNGKAMYHASAVVASNYLVTLMDFAFKILQEAGIPENEAFKVLSPLVEGTLANIKNVGTVKALTGPIARGDISTIKTHLENISDKSPELLNLYKMLGFFTTEIAKQKGTISESIARELRKIL